MFKRPPSEEPAVRRFPRQVDRPKSEVVISLTGTPSAKTALRPERSASVIEAPPRRDTPPTRRRTPRERDRDRNEREARQRPQRSGDQRQRRRREHIETQAIEPRPAPAPAPVIPQDLPEQAAFGELTVSGAMGHALDRMGYSEPTPVQSRVIPLAAQGLDVVGQAQTGTGKTAAFGIPIVELIDGESTQIQALVLTPTRELAMQVSEEIASLGQFQGVRCLTVYGGQSMNVQLDGLRRRPQVVVATPGRLMDHMSRRTISLSDVRIVVLDEADQMLDIGFVDDIERILRATPSTRQTLLFSATMPGPIRRLARRYLREPEWIRVGGDAEPVEQVDQLYYEVAAQDRPAALDELLADQEKVTQALIFRRTKVGVDRLVYNLERHGFDAEAIHGDMTQAHRERVMRRFKEKRLRVLVATNVAARGLDIPAVSHVINYDMPGNLEEYVHRIGRTARMGRPGTAIMFVSDVLDFSTLDIIQEHVGGDLRQERLAFLYG